MPFLLLQGDISQIKTDAVVNSADTGLLGGGAVSECLHKTAGSRLKRACTALNGCAAGEVKVTEGYNLPCKYIIHAVAPVWQGGQNGEEALLASCYRRALQEAAELGCSSVAFPLLAAGVNGYPKEQALRVASETIAEFLQERELDVFLVFLDRESFPKDFIPNYKELHSSIVRSLFEILRFFRSVADEYYYSKYYYKGWPVLLDGPKAWIEYEAGDYYRRHEEVDRVKEYDEAEKNKNDSFAGTLQKLSMLLRHVVALDDLSGDPRKTWKEMLIRLMALKGLSCEQCANRANIRSDYLRKLCSDEDIAPSKYTALALASALELSVDEAREMLAKMGFTWQRCDLFEVITEFFMDKGIYDVHKVNFALFAYRQRLLGIFDPYADERMKHKKLNEHLSECVGKITKYVGKITKRDIENSDSTKKNESITYSDDGTILLHAAEGCSSVTIHSGVALVDEYAFKDCRSLIDVSIPVSVKTIGSCAFQNCISLKSVNLPAHLASVSPYLFGNCRRLTETELPDDIADISEGAFFNCDRLSFVKLPVNLKSIGNNAFWNCRSLEMLDIPAGVEEIGSGAFYNCRSLSGINLPAGLKIIEDRTFMNCRSLTAVTLPAGVSDIGWGAFSDCSSLVSVDIAGGEDDIGEAGPRETAAQAGGEIGVQAFFNCRKLTSVRLPSSIITIGYSAFAYCESLRDISIPDSVTEIKDSAFVGCKSLNPLVVPDNVSKIADDAFEGVPCVVYDGTAEGAPWGAEKVVPRRAVLLGSCKESDNPR